MVTIYRVQDARGYGMYCSDSLASSNMQEISGSHPMPEADSRLMSILPADQKPYPTPAFRFGFGSIDQLKRWIYDPKWRHSLHDEGLTVGVYECSEQVYVGDTQAIFLPEYAKQVSTLSLLNI